MAKLRWALSAVKDLEAICEFIAEDSELYARILQKGYKYH